MAAGGGGEPWWAGRAAIVLLAAAMLVPFLGVAVIPLFDLPGHMGRYAVEAGGDPLFARDWRVGWIPVANLGVDLLAVPLSRAIGVERATWIAVAAIPALTAAGFLLCARARHGTLPPTAAFALPLAMGYPFQFGFVNYAIAMAGAYCGFAMWLSLGRRGLVRTRAAVTAVVAPLLWLAHLYGWGVLAILCGADALVEAWRARDRPRAALPTFAGRVAPLCVPLLAMLWWHGGAGVAVAELFDMRAKYGWVESALRDHWKALDGVSVELLVLVIAAGWLGLMRVDAVLGLAAVLLGVAYLLVPGKLIGSTYTDMRLAPFVLATALLALRPRAATPAWANGLAAAAAILFVIVRVGATAAGYRIHEAEYDRQLAAVAHIPRGARIFAIVAPPCERGWDGPRLDHLASLAIVRRHAFTNDQWTDDGAQLIHVAWDVAPEWSTSGSQLARLPDCDRPEPLLAQRIAGFPRDRYDMLWLIGVPPAARPRDPALRPVWASPSGALYQVVRAPR